MAEQRQKYSSDIDFNGSRISPEIQRRLEALQNSAAKDKFGYSKFSYNEGSGEQQMTYKDAFKSRNFDGAGELSSRKPWARIWTAIEPYDKKRFENFRIVDVDITTSFFSEQNQKPLLWYYKTENGEIEYYTAPGLHPVNGKTLKAVTEYIIEKYVPIHQNKPSSFVRQ